MTGTEGDQPAGAEEREDDEAPREPHEHPLVASIREDPGRPATPTVTVTGLFGRSEDPERRRVYFTSQLDYYAEFCAEDVLLYEPVPVGEFSAPGYEATRVTLKAGSRIDFTYARTDSVLAEDQFDLDIRLDIQEYHPDAGATGDTCVPPNTRQGLIVDRTMRPTLPTRSTCNLIVDRTMYTFTCLHGCAPPRC